MKWEERDNPPDESQAAPSIPDLLLLDATGSRDHDGHTIYYMMTVTDVTMMTICEKCQDDDLMLSDQCDQDGDTILLDLGEK
ncbi:hypothetical protein CEXT_242901 [Caerostris extrusa]|uniref:Uncharacterized protein n=1 Tax=Caerostris extrusa TaxID=172846 RepID=A0AAV4P092_CAEEX|nr:hypothetical protein CEXT_242901 [Caerostris extrusa]